MANVLELMEQDDAEEDPDERQALEQTASQVGVGGVANHEYHRDEDEKQVHPNPDAKQAADRQRPGDRIVGLR